MVKVHTFRHFSGKTSALLQYFRMYAILSDVGSTMPTFEFLSHLFFTKWAPKWEWNKETSSAFREKTTQTFFRVSNTGTPKKAPPTFLYLWAKNGRILPIWATWHPLTFQPVLPPKSWKLVTIRLAFSAQPLHCSKNFTHEWQVGTICNNLQAKIPPSLRNCTQ